MDHLSRQQPTTLGQAALGYLKVCLSAGQSLIAAQKALPLETGRLWAYLPAGLTAQQKLDPVWSLACALGSYPGRGDADLKLEEFIRDFLQGGSGRYAVFQDYGLAYGEALDLAEEGHVFTFRSEAYRLLRIRDAKSDNFLAIIRRGYMANSRMNAGVLTVAPLVTLPRNGEEATPEVVHALISGVEHIIVEGFDGEREIIWSRRDGRDGGTL